MTDLARNQVSVRSSLGFSLMQQLVILTLGAMLLDGGQTFQVVGYAAVAYWVGLVLMMVQRARSLTDADKILIRWGYLMLTVVSALVTGAVSSLRGY